MHIASGRRQNTLFTHTLLLRKVHQQTAYIDARVIGILISAAEVLTLTLSAMRKRHVCRTTAFATTATLFTGVVKAKVAYWAIPTALALAICGITNQGIAFGA